MTVEKKEISKTSMCLLVWVVVIIWLLIWILSLLYSMKEEINYVRSDAFNAYDTSDATYQKLRVLWNDVENILQHVDE
jgi:hypothetical protein